MRRSAAPDSSSAAKRRIAEIVKARAAHTSLDQVTSTMSDWHVEQTLRREYHGRFLLELVQNAADAWTASRPGSDDGVLAIRLGADRSMTVANQGQFLPVERIIHSISKVGQSPKLEGAAIGHKGIGFKSVLEVSLTPQIFSRRDVAGPFEIRVAYDPDQAVGLVTSMSDDWDGMVRAAAVEADIAADPSHVPLLMFPLWVEDQPAWLSNASAIDGIVFNTIIRLAHDARFDDRLGIDGDEWMARMRRAIDGLADTIVLLLGSFRRIVIEDEAAGTRQLIEREVRQAAERPDGTKVSEVAIRRNRQTTSEWLLYQRRLAQVGRGGLDSELAVGVRVETGSDDNRRPIVPDADPTAPGNCYHLFFPTEIPTRVPLLLHAYFQVDAGRRGFAADATAHNQALLAGLVELATGAVEHLAAGGEPWRVDAVSLPDLFAAADGDHEDALARRFHAQLLERLDDVRWIAARGAAGRRLVQPRKVLAEPRGELGLRLAEAFRPGYVIERLARFLPDDSLSAAAIRFLDRRQHTGDDDASTGVSVETYEALLEPGNAEPWAADADAYDHGFRAVLRLLQALSGVDSAGAHIVFDRIRGHPDAAIVPVRADGPLGRKLRHFPPKADPGRSIEGGMILARAGSLSTQQLAPPESLRVDFLGGALEPELLNGIAGRLGISDYSNDSVLNALASAPAEADPAELVRFVWQLLRDEVAATYAIATVAGTLGAFDPGAWFWARHRDRTEAERRRHRGLARMRLPAVDGVWRPAERLALGGAWAEWIESLPAEANLAQPARAQAYRLLDDLAPGPAALVTGPSVLGELLPEGDPAVAAQWFGVDLDAIAPDDLHRASILAFLLRLGVWEVPPVEAYHNELPRPAETRVPWSDAVGRDAHMAAVGGLPSEFNRYQHQNVHVAEDYRFHWPLSGNGLEHALGLGVALYRDLLALRRFCPGCRTHTTRYHDNPAPEASYLAHELRTSAWVPVLREGTPAERRVQPREAWFELDVPDPSRIRQSPLRFLNLVDEEFDEHLARLAEIASIERAPSARLVNLLRDLRAYHDESGEAITTGTEVGRAFAGLHRLLYERLHLQAKEEAAKEAVARSIAEIRVLASHGSSLRYVPPGEARHDNGNASTWKPIFGGRIPFIVLKADQGPVAATLGVPPFAVDVMPEIGSHRVDVTEEVRSFIHDRAPELLALMCFTSIGGPLLVPGSQQFNQRATRLAALTVQQVDDLVLHLHVRDTEERDSVGHGAGGDLLVQGARSVNPVLLHDLTGDGWQDRLRRAAGAPLAQLLENDAYRGEFQLLLLEESEAGRVRFLRERGIDDAHLDEVGVEMGYADRTARELASRWWRVVLPLLGAAPPADVGDLAAVREALAAAGRPAESGSLAASLLGSFSDPAVRSDVSDGGVLQALERSDVSLRVLHDELVRAGDDGLRVGVASRRLTDWRRQHRRAVVAALTKLGVAYEVARHLPDGWGLDAETDFLVDPDAAVWLAPALKDLERSVNAPVDVTRLAGPGAEDYLAELAGGTAEDLAHFATTLSDPAERASYERQVADEWRKLLVPLVVASRVRPGDERFRIRDERDEVDRELASVEPSTAALGGALRQLLTAHAALGDAVARWMEKHSPLGAPRWDDLVEVAAEHWPDVTHLQRVRDVLQEGVRRSVQDLRRSVQLLEAADVAPVPFEGSQAPMRAPRKDRQRIPVDHPPRKHDAEQRERFGRSGEKWAIAAVVRELFALEPAARREAVEAMVEVLTAIFESDRVEALAAKAAEAVAPDADEDDVYAALETFVHVSAVSDQFGFDVLGHLPLYRGGAPEVAFLEVKSAQSRTIKVSRTEWERANDPRLRDRYCFMVVLRGPGETPARMELVPDPATRRERNELALREESWEVTYSPVEPEPSAPSGSDTSRL